MELSPEYIPCGFIHEEGNVNQTLFDRKLAISKVLACQLRRNGNNMLCAHVDILPNGEMADIGLQLESKIELELQKIGNSYLLHELRELNTFKHILDDFIRTANYIRESLRSIIIPVKLDSPEVRKIIGEIVSIFQACKIPIPNNCINSWDFYSHDRTNLNSGQKSRIRFLVVKLQKMLEKLYQDLIGRIKSCI